ncbi:MAG: hypothetical protein JHC33_03255, partial [Ignisphaera sp.]|nr:hypothetical protein [Ignisphaera sp.]
MSIYALVEERLKELISQWERIYVEKSVRSRELYERAKRVFPAGVTYGIRF